LFAQILHLHYMFPGPTSIGRPVKKLKKAKILFLEKCPFFGK